MTTGYRPLALTILAIWMLLPRFAATPLSAPPQVIPSNIHVSPGGAPENDGSVNSPLDLRTALSEHSPARIGDTIWLRQGTYRGQFVSVLKGTHELPITVRSYPGERATIDSAPLDGAPSFRPGLDVRGDWVIFRDLEFTNSDEKRSTEMPGSWPDDLRRGAGILGVGSHLRFINLVAHDLTTGIEMWSESVDSEIYGNVIFHNGWQGPDRAHGHGIYTQNQTGHREIAENIIFNQFSHGIHAFGSDDAYLDYITLRGNVVFNNGVLGGGFERDILLGGGRVALNPVVEENITFSRGQNNLGYSAGCEGGRVSKNYFVARVPLLLVRCFLPVMDNTFFSSTGDEMNWLADLHPNNTYHGARPSGTKVWVRPNRYEPGRAHIVVFNWNGARRVRVELTATGLRRGDRYQILDAQNYFGPPVVSGVYRSRDRVDLPMDRVTVAMPVGNVTALPKHTAPEFAVFIVKPVRTVRVPSR